ncbi:ABC transporter permease [bacterium]|nr:ABC transporter permease [bacterium]
MNQFALDFLFRFLFSRRAGALIKTISWLSIFGIGIGVCSLIIVLSVMNGFNRSIRERKFSVEPHLIVLFEQKSMKEVQQHPATLWLQKQKDIEMSITETQDLILRSSDGFVQGAIAQGVSDETIQLLLHTKNKKQFSDKQEKPVLKAGEILVGVGLGDIMGLFEGDSVVALSPESLLTSQDGAKKFETVKIKDFIQTEIEDIDTRKIYYQIDKTLLRFRNTASLERTIELRIPNPEDFSAIKKKIESFNVKVDSWQDRNSNLFYSLKLEKFVVGLLLGLSTLIASFSLVTVMILLVTQKRKDIGLMLALGFHPLVLRKTFVRVGLFLGSLGIFSGMFLGLFLCLLIRKYSHGMLPNIYEDTNIPVEVHLSQIGFVLLIACVVSLATTWVSVRQLSRWVPSLALRGLSS